MAIFFTLPAPGCSSRIAHCFWLLATVPAGFFFSPVPSSWFFLQQSMQSPWTLFSTPCSSNMLHTRRPMPCYESPVPTTAVSSHGSFLIYQLRQVCSSNTPASDAPILLRHTSSQQFQQVPTPFSAPDQFPASTNHPFLCQLSWHSMADPIPQANSLHAKANYPM